MERLQVKGTDELAKDWEFVCTGCGRIVFSMASAAKALYCRHCQSELIPVWLPLNVPRYAVPVRVSTQCPHCWESLLITVSPEKIPFRASIFTCRHCLGRVEVNFRKQPISIKKAR